MAPNVLTSSTVGLCRSRGSSLNGHLLAISPALVDLLARLLDLLEHRLIFKALLGLNLGVLLLEVDVKLLDTCNIATDLAFVLAHGIYRADKGLQGRTCTGW